MACRIGAAWLIVVLIICLPGTFIVTYVIAVLVGHIRPLWPYISDTGTLPPESCIFGQMLNISSVFIALIVYIRYHIVSRCFVNSSVRLRHGNCASMVCGFLSAAGITIVGNFQLLVPAVFFGENLAAVPDIFYLLRTTYEAGSWKPIETNVKSLHYLGAVMAFGFGVVYISINGVISYWSIPSLNGHQVFGLRIVCCFTSTAALICIQYEHQNLLSTIAEWAMSFVLVVFFITFIPEFKAVQLQFPVVKFSDPSEA